MSAKARDAALQVIKDAVDEAVADKTITKAELVDLLEEAVGEIEMNIDCYKQELAEEGDDE